MNPEARKRNYLLWSVVLVGLPCALLVLPLFFHTSPKLPPGAWSPDYSLFVTITCVLAAVLAVTLAIHSHRRRSLSGPLYFDFLVFLAMFLFLASETILTRTLKAQDPFDEYKAWGHKRSAFFGFEAAPNNSWGGGKFTTDRYGFRTHANGSWDDGSPGPRIFALGESSTFGFGLGNSETWSHLLENRLREKYHSTDIDVINAGNNAFNALQAFLKYHLRVRPHHPTTLIYYGARNDVYGGETTNDQSLFMIEAVLTAPSIMNFWALQSQGQNLYVRSLTYYFLVHEVPFLKKLQTWQQALTGHGILATHAFADTQAPAENLPPRVKQLLDQLPSEDANWRMYITKNAQNVFLFHLKGMCDLARTSGTRVILTTFLQNFEPTNRIGITIQAYNEYLREFAVKEGLPLVDLEERFRNVPNKEEYFFDDKYHPSIKGAQFIAEQLASAWQEEWLKPLPIQR